MSRGGVGEQRREKAGGPCEWGRTLDIPQRGRQACYGERGGGGKETSILKEAAKTNHVLIPGLSVLVLSRVSPPPQHF